MVIGRSRRPVTAAMAENSPGRSDPRIGGVVIEVDVRVCFFRFVFGGREIVMVVGLVGLWEGVGRGRVCERKFDRGSCRVPGVKSVGRVEWGMSGIVRER